MAHKTGSWEKAQRVELVEPMDSAVVGKSRELIAIEEAKLQHKLYGPRHNSYESDWRSSGKGEPWSGKGAPWKQDRGEEKGAKAHGKGKDKGKNKGKKGNGKS